MEPGFSHKVFLKTIFIAIMVVVVSSCSTPTEKDKWIGTWNAKWETDRNAEGYEEIPAEYVFKMDGQFDFSAEDVTISAYGFPKCIFQIDTTEHAQKWEVRGDTLQLISGNGEFSLHYKILNQSGTETQLQLLDDIFITLTKK